MTPAQELWWAQAKSDHEVFVRLRDGGVEPCHLLHYLQMTTEKLAKAYLWRSGNPPPKAHTGFVRFLRALASRNDDDLVRIAEGFGFGRPEDFVKWVRSVLPLAYLLQNTAPALANNGPNPEYPWPYENPTHTPTRHEFSLWTELSGSGRGTQLLNFLRTAVGAFPGYA